MKKLTLFILTLCFGLAIYLVPVNSKAEWGIKDKWDEWSGYCHGDPVDCFGEIIKKPL